MANISSRTPEGEPYQCPICGAQELLKPTVLGDLCCPRCGQLIWEVRDRFSEIVAEQEFLFSELGADSLDQVELVMELEEHFDITIPASEAEQIQTVDQAIRYITRLLRERQQGSPPTDV